MLLNYAAIRMPKCVDLIALISAGNSLRKHRRLTIPARSCIPRRKTSGIAITTPLPSNEPAACINPAASAVGSTVRCAALAEATAAVAARLSVSAPDAAPPAAAEDPRADSGAGSPSAAAPADVLDRSSRWPFAARRSSAAAAAEPPDGIATGSVASQLAPAPLVLPNAQPPMDWPPPHSDLPDGQPQDLQPLLHAPPHSSLAGSSAPRPFLKRA